MQYVVSLPRSRELRLYFNKQVYSPAYSSVDTIVVADTLIQRIFRGELTPTILDVGCGSGVVGLGLKRLWPTAAVTLSDAFSEPLRISRLNAKRNGLQIRVIEADLLRGVGYHDIITANLPTYDSDQLATEPLYGPEEAYDGNGLALYDRLLTEAKDRCLVLVCECQEKYQQRFLELAEDRGYRLVLQAGAAFGFLHEEQGQQ